MQGMPWDSITIIMAVTLITGAVWGLDKVWLGPRQRDGAAPDTASGPGGFVEFCRSFFPLVLGVLVLLSFVVQPFVIPSGSMLPTLLIGDYVLVNKFVYGLRDPLFHYKLLALGAPQRGDVAVFRWPVDERTDFIKRIVGLPGDHIAYRNKQLFVNGEAASVSPDSTFDLQDAARVQRMDERLGDVAHKILVNPNRPAEDFSFTVPPGEYFAMGDNRDNSADSRYWGTVPEANLVGKAFFIPMSWDSANWRINFARIGTGIR
jgi:signal peptidase I